jgi:hypothetical protein
MRYSDDNQQGLLSLLAASQDGLDPTTAYGMMQDIQGQQEAQNAQRQERQSGLIGMLMEAAQGGMPYGGASALLDAAPGPMGPALQSALSSLYPTGEDPRTNASGAVMDFPTGSRPTPTGLTPPTGPTGMQYQAAGVGPGYGDQVTSPAFQPPEPSISDQQAIMEMEQQQAMDADLTALQADASQQRANGLTVDQFIAEASKQNPELFATAGEDVMAIIENTFGAGAVETRGMPSIG